MIVHNSFTKGMIDIEKTAAGAVRGLFRKALDLTGKGIESGAKGLHKGLYRPVKDSSGKVITKGGKPVRTLSGRRMLAAGAGTFLAAKGIGAARGQQSRAAQGYRNVYDTTYSTPMM